MLYCSSVYFHHETVLLHMCSFKSCSNLREIVQIMFWSMESSWLICRSIYFKFPLQGHGQHTLRTRVSHYPKRSWLCWDIQEAGRRVDRISCTGRESSMCKTLRYDILGISEKVEEECSDRLKKWNGAYSQGDWRDTRLRSAFLLRLDSSCWVWAV